MSSWLRGLPRAVPLEGQPNFRDLGGYPAGGGRRVRFGVLYRSGVLDRLTAADLETVRGLRIATVIDLRGDDEVARRVDRLPPGTRVIRVPVLDVSHSPAAIAARLEAGDTDGLGAEALVRGNRAFVLGQRRSDGAAPPFGDFLRAVMDRAHHPLLFHCTAGKDRAGFAAALVLLTLGVPGEAVVHDYLASNELLAARHEAILAEAAGRLPDVEALRAMLQVRAEYIGAALDAMRDEYSSVDAYLRDGLGVTDGERDRFRDVLLEPA